MDDLIKELIDKIQELNPKFSESDVVNAHQTMHFIERKFKNMVYKGTHISMHKKIMMEYFHSKDIKLKKLLSSRGLDASQQKEVIEELFKIFVLTFRNFTATTGFQTFDIDVFLKQFHSILETSEYFAVLEEHYPRIKMQLYGIINSSVEPAVKQNTQKAIEKLHKEYNQSPSGEMMHELDEFYIFLKQCIWVADRLCKSSREQQEQLLNAIPKSSFIYDDKLNAMLIKWLRCPALTNMQDQVFSYNNTNTTLRLAIDKIEADINNHGITISTINTAHSIANVFSVPTNENLEYALAKLKILQDNNLMLLFAIIRLVNKTHEDDEEKSLYLGSGFLAKVIAVPETETALQNFVKILNKIEIATLKALDNNVSFKELNLSDNPHKKIR